MPGSGPLAGMKNSQKGGVFFFFKGNVLNNYQWLGIFYMIFSDRIIHTAYLNPLIRGQKLGGKTSQT